MSTALLVTADDFGAGVPTDRGILHAFRHGIVTGASLLANGSSFVEAARAAVTEGMPVGVHLNLSEGRPLSGPLTGLTTPAGDFPGKEEARRRLAGGRINRHQLRAEIKAQMARLAEAGLQPDHLDAHQHCYLFPLVCEAVCEIAPAFGIRAARLPLPAEPQSADPPEKLGAELALYRRLAPPTGVLLRQSGFLLPDGLWGMPLLGRLNETALGQLLRQLPAGTWELMTHPGYADPKRPFATGDREQELAALTSPVIRELLAERGIRLVSFRELSCAS